MIDKGPEINVTISPGLPATQETRTLADIATNFQLDRIDLIKMDIKGFEYEGVLGSPELFRHRIVRHFSPDSSGGVYD